MIAFISSCDSDSNNNNERNLLLLGAFALSSPTSNSLLSPAQRTATSAAQTTAAVASSVATSAGTSGATALLGPQRVERFLADIIQNGRDPIYIREATAALKAEIAPRLRQGGNVAQLAAVTFTQNGTENGKNKYTFAGTVDGRTTTSATLNLGQYSPYLGGNCPVTIKSADPTKAVGTATISNGVLTYSGTGSGTGFSGTSKQTATISFSNFGLVYHDVYSLYKAMQSNGLAPTNLFSTSTTCPQIQTLYNLFNSYLREESIASGSMTSEYSSSFSFGTGSLTNTYTAKGVSQPTVTINGVPTSFDITYGFSFVQSGTSLVLTITMSGLVNGSAINDTLTTTF